MHVAIISFSLCQLNLNVTLQSLNVLFHLDTLTDERSVRKGQRAWLRSPERGSVKQHPTWKLDGQTEDRAPGKTELQRI
jgi:hypothetical protein